MTEDLDKVKGVSYDTKHKLETHEQICALRYAQILEKLELNTTHIDSLTRKVEELTTLATKGQTSLATLIWLGSAVTAVVTFLIVVLKGLKVI